jgi:hypothetical protein
MADPAISTRWQLSSVTAPAAGRRGVASATEDTFLASLTGEQFEVEQSFIATSPQRRGVEALPPLDITIPAEPGAVYLLAVRHASGALSFHAATEAPTEAPAGAPVSALARRSAEAAPLTVTFEVVFPDAPDEPTRRSIISKIVKCVVLKALGKLADLAVPWIGSEVEETIWKAKHLRQGWLQVTAATLASGSLAPANFGSIHSPADRCLLLLHGTFSNAEGGFHDLVTARTAAGKHFFDEVAPLYGDRIFAFNHFTVSKTPEKNAQELIDALPVTANFDVITHSRGGLVLRNLVERASALGPHASRFKLGKAILVASPNQGTPLATAKRFETLIGWWSNLLELFPENPFTTTADYIGAALTFIARHVVDALPGLESMDMEGPQIATLNKPSPQPPPPGAYSALISNYLPTGNVLARLADLGIDGIFGLANDLVVPSEGAWKTEDRTEWVTGTRIGCFGQNISSAAAHDVTHTTYFSQPETSDFLIKTLTAQPLGIAPLDPDIHLPMLMRRGLSMTGAPGVPAMAPSRAREAAAATPGFLPTPLAEADDVLQLFLISTEGHLPAQVLKSAKDRSAILLATYRNARVVKTIYLSAAPPKRRAAAVSDEDSESHWKCITDINDRIKDYVDGKAKAELPDDTDIHQLGENLFNALFPGSVRRLYDVARVDRARAGKRLDIVVTSMINWVADKPWEFAYDPNRQSFLATEAVNFTRNVLTAVPADEPPSHPGKALRILVVVAQPIGLGLLSAEEELSVVSRGFQTLQDAGLAELEFMMHARVEDLHERLRRPDIDILHFIGHGEYNEDEEEGYLVFENRDGGVQLVNSESLRQILCQRGIRLVFLNACETGMVGRSENPFDFNRGVAPKLVAGGIPILVANQYKVLDVSATEFARTFYWWLALGSTVGDAAREARVAVNYSITVENIDWAVPVVYARNPGRMIYDEDEKRRVEETLRPLAAPPQTVASRALKGVTMVGLWDVNHVLPDLDAFAATLNAKQTQFRFRAVDVSDPLGTWRRIASENTAPNPPGAHPPARGINEGYISGNEVAIKLQDQVDRLGVDRLICITAFGLMDEAEKDLGLWNEDQKQRISIISGKLIFAQPDPAAHLNRFLANMAVSALCGAGTDHTIPPENCPNYVAPVNPDPAARLAYLTARYQICDACAKKLGPWTESLNKILSIW